MLLNLEKLSWYLPTAGQLMVLITRLCCPAVSLGSVSSQNRVVSPWTGAHRAQPRPNSAGAQQTLTDSSYWAPPRRELQVHHRPEGKRCWGKGKGCTCKEGRWSTSHAAQEAAPSTLRSWVSTLRHLENRQVWGKRKGSGVWQTLVWIPALQFLAWGRGQFTGLSVPHQKQKTKKTNKQFQLSTSAMEMRESLYNSTAWPVVGAQ